VGVGVGVGVSVREALWCMHEDNKHIVGAMRRMSAAVLYRGLASRRDIRQGTLCMGRF
jgi:hypothetical protein